MPLDRDDLEDLDREGLIDALLTLSQEVEALKNRYDRRTMNAIEKANTAGDDIESLSGRLDRLEDQVEMVDATMPAQQKNKLQKVRDIIQYAMDEGTGGRRGVKVTTGECTAAAGASRQTARRLMDEIGSTFPWADVKTPGGPNPKELRLAIVDRDLDDLMDDVRAQYGGETA